METITTQWHFDVPPLYAQMRSTLWLMSAAERFHFERNMLGSPLEIATGFLRAASKTASRNAEAKASLSKELLVALGQEIKNRSNPIESSQPSHTSIGANA